MRTEDQEYGQDRDDRHNNIYRYNSDSVRMFYSIGIIEPDTSQNRSLDGVGKATRKKNRGRSREVNIMKVRCRRTRSRGSVLTTRTTRTMLTTCAADCAESLLRDMKDYLPDLILTTKVLNLLIRCYRNYSGHH